MNIDELREKCQSSRKKCDTWYGRNFARKISIFITVLFVKINLHAMTATTIFLLCGIMSSVMFFLGDKTSMLVGAVLLQFWYILDHVDGEVARYNEESSLTGLYYDELVHYIVHPLVFFGIGLGLFRLNGNIIYVVTGIVSGLSIVLLGLIIDIKRLGVLEVICKNQKKSCNFFAIREDISRNSFMRKFFSVIYATCTYPSIMNVITVSAIIDFLSGSLVICYVLSAYSLLLIFVLTIRMSVFIVGRRVDMECG